MKKKKENKPVETQEQVQARLNAFNQEMAELVKKHKVKLDINQRIVVIDDKPAN